MNYRGSYRHLLRNAKAVMLAAVETYNEPRSDYSEEGRLILFNPPCFLIGLGLS